MALRWSRTVRSSMRAVTPLTTPAAALSFPRAPTSATACVSALTAPISALCAASGAACAGKRLFSAAAAATPASASAPVASPASVPSAAPAFAHFPSPSADAGFAPRAAMPGYMQRVYWWAYLQPWSPAVFDHPFVVNAILWGNYNRLRDAAVAEYDSFLASRRAAKALPPADCLQIACAYGSVSPSLYSALPPGARLELLDISTVQLGIAADKLSRDRVSVPLPGPARSPAASVWEGLTAAEAGEGEAGPVAGATVFCDRAHAPLGVQGQGEPTRVTLRQGDAMNLSCYSSGEFGYVLSFFLLHEVPAAVRRRAVAEAFRVAAPGGKVVFVDYHEPVSANPVKPIMKLVNRFLEPFAEDLWREPISSFLGPAEAARVASRTEEHYFGGLYQKVVFTLAEEDAPAAAAAGETVQ